MIYVELLIYVGKPFGGVNDQTAIMEEIQKLLVSRFIIQSWVWTSDIASGTPRRIPEQTPTVYTLKFRLLIKHNLLHVVLYH
jgi:hypothetical protein